MNQYHILRIRTAKTHLIVYIVAFIIVLYLSIQLQSCQSVFNKLTYLLTRRKYRKYC